MKDRKDKIARVVMAGLGYAATELMTFPGVPPWLALVAKGVVVVLAAGSPSVVGIQRTQYTKSATPGGVDQAVDPERPRR